MQAVERAALHEETLAQVNIWLEQLHRNLDAELNDSVPVRNTDRLLHALLLAGFFRNWALLKEAVLTAVPLVVGGDRTVVEHCRRRVSQPHALPSSSFLYRHQLSLVAAWCSVMQEQRAERGANVEYCSYLLGKCGQLTTGWCGLDMAWFQRNLSHGSGCLLWQSDGAHSDYAWSRDLLGQAARLCLWERPMPGGVCRSPTTRGWTHRGALRQLTVAIKPTYWSRERQGRLTVQSACCISWRALDATQLDRSCSRLIQACMVVGAVLEKEPTFIVQPH